MEFSPLEESIDIINTVLASGHSVDLPATGYSMFPLLLPGDKVTVKPISKGEIPGPGNVVVFRSKSGLVLHRVVKLTKSLSGAIIAETQGDSLLVKDQPLNSELLIGIAISFKRNGKIHPIKKFLPGLLRYRFNNLFLQVYIKLRKIVPG